MLRNILAGSTALALVIGFATGASANPQNRFGDNNTAAAIAMADANADSGAVELAGVAGVAGGAGVGGEATAYAESFNSDIEVISVQEMTATINGAPIVVFAGIGGAGGNGANRGNGDFAVAASVSLAGGNGGAAAAGVATGTGGTGGHGGAGGAGNGGVLSAGATTVAAGAGTFGGIANMNVASGYFNSALGGVSPAGTGSSSRDGAQRSFSASLSGR